MYKKMSDTLVLPDLIQLRDNLIMARYDLMKILPAKHIIETAIAKKQIDPTTPLVETSSGTFALGMGIVCAEQGIPFHIISDPAIDPVLKRRLVQLGGKVQILSKALQAENPQIVRLNELKDYLDANKSAYWTCQYDNPLNQDAYHLLGDYLLHHVGKDFTLVGTVGSGGSTSGTIKHIRRTQPKTRLVGVDTFGSVLFGLKNDKRILRGLGNSLFPKNLNHTYYDEVHWVFAEEAFYHTRALHAEKAIFCGPTTGAAYQVAEWISRKDPHQMVVFIAPDSGYRYQSSVYNDAWLKKNNISLRKPGEPRVIDHPSEASRPWSLMHWNRRTFDTVMEGRRA